MCNYKTNIWSEPLNEKINTNKGIVAGTVTVAIGYSQLEELCAAAKIRCMSDKTYIKYREELVDDFERTAMENMKRAGLEEKQFAINKHETINGIPYITVVADGSWMKRSYGNAYDSLSGVGAIIGFRTGKVLFVGIKNKYCTVCNFAELKGTKPNNHKCYKNFDRNVSSTKMESDAIVEGFKKSIEMHGLIYKTVVADGDSNVYQSIIHNRPYKKQMVRVKKIECTNHLLRNLCKKLKTVAETTQPKLQRNHSFVELRNILKNNILKIRKEVIEAAALRREEKKPHHFKALQLQKDILNIPSHVFGEHKRCTERGRRCRESSITVYKNYVPSLIMYGLYQKIETAIKYISGYSDSLLINLTNNPAESFNSIICKEIGGKRINFGTRGSYNIRIAGSVIQYNTQQVLTQVHKTISGNVPPVIEHLEIKRQKKIARTKQSREINGRKRKFKREVGTDCYYGPQSQKPDLSYEMYEQLRQNHMKKLYENGRNCKKIERETIAQKESDLWQILRQEMLTASNFGIVCRMRLITSCEKIVKNILFPPSIDSKAMKYGRDMEDVARKELSMKLNKKINVCGLFIDYENPFLGASPDGLIDEDGVVEIKCPLLAENLTAEEAIQTLPQLKSIYDKTNLNKMNKNHQFFYQIQGQLNITQRQYCMFALWTPKSMKIVQVIRDEVFWRDLMLPYLKRFYYECMLPEILDSRYNRHMPIRNPKYILEAKEASKKKSNRKINQYNNKENDNIEINNIENNIEDEKIIEGNKRKKTLLNIDSKIKAVENIILDTEQNDCTFIGYYNKQDITKEDVVRHKKILDDTIASLSLVKENVLPPFSKLNDESLDRFLRVIRDTSCFETQSVLYLEYPHCITASSNSKSLQIIGGNCTDHWRCIFFDGSKLHVYDSLPGCTYQKLANKEKRYIHLRYPKLSENDIIFEEVQKQPDYTCCGIYAAAFATTIALGGNPCNETYTNNVQIMRNHFVQIIENNKLLSFPKQ